VKGGAEEIVAEAIHGQHHGVVVVTKVCPHNAPCEKLPKACGSASASTRLIPCSFILPGDALPNFAGFVQT
jgi:hypothetical protein